MDSAILNRAIPPGSLRSLAVLYAPEHVRTFVQAMYVVELEVRESGTSSSHDVAHTRLRWWREEIERLNQGRPQHPATKALGAFPGRIDWSALQQLIFAADVELSRMTFDSDRELHAYLDRSGGVVQQKIAQLVASNDLNESLLNQVRTLGATIREAELLRDLRREAHNGRLMVPMDDLHPRKITHEALASPDLSPAVRDLVSERAAKALDRLRTSIRTIQPADAIQIRPVLVMTALHERILERLAAGRYQTSAPLQLGNFERVWVAWRAALRAR